jgi:diketogulonate reductase-like aldo/keto reductase
VLTAKKDEKQGLERTIVPMKNPPPILLQRSLTIPRVGYSFFKTAPEQAERCANLALLVGVTHFDMATAYNSNTMIAPALQRYFNEGRKGLEKYMRNIEKPELVDMLLATNRRSGNRGGSKGRKTLFLSHKLSNDEQSTDRVKVRQSVISAIESIGSVGYLDMVSIHSPLTDSSRRLSTYGTLLDAQREGLLRAVGVCNYGLGPLQEIADAGLPLPAVNQLELSPFNAHRNVVDWCNANGVAVSCAAWSRLSSADGPTKQWDVLSQIAQNKGMTKAQILVRWSLQNGFLCVPRSGCGSKLERVAIAENSYGGVNSRTNELDILTMEEMKILDGLDVGYKAGRLGRNDGWKDSDVTGPNWDPIDFL